MKIRKLNFNYLRNDEHFQFGTEFKSLVEDFSSETLKIKAQFTDWKVLYSQEDEALKKIMKSAFTEELHIADQKRDETFRGMVLLNQSALRHFKENIKAAARRLQIVFDTYKNVSDMTMNAQTSAIYNLINELLLEKYEADVELVGMKDWITELDENNGTFDSINKDRYDESATRTTLVMKDVRTEIDAAYRIIAERIDALSLVEGSETFTKFVKRLNVVIEKYHNTIAQRQGTDRK